MRSNLWIDLMTLAGCAAGMFLCAFIYRRGLLSQWPALFSLSAFHVASQVALIFLRPHYAVYFYSFWASRAIEAMLQVYLISDFLRSLPGKDGISPFTRHVFGYVAALLALGAWFISSNGAAADARFSEKLLATVLLINRSVDVTWGVFAMSCILSVSVLGMGWRLRASRIAGGYVAAMLCRVSCSYAYVLHTSWLRTLANEAEVCIWTCVSLFWVSAILRPDTQFQLDAEQIRTIRRHLNTPFLPDPLSRKGSAND